MTELGGMVLLRVLLGVAAGTFLGRWIYSWWDRARTVPRAAPVNSLIRVCDTCGTARNHYWKSCSACDLMDLAREHVEIAQITVDKMNVVVDRLDRIERQGEIVH